MAKAKREKLYVKAISGFNAFSSVNPPIRSVFESLMFCLLTSPICETTGYAIKSDKLVGTSPTPTTALKDPHSEGLYEVLCGTSHQQAIDALEKEGRAFMNLTGFNGLYSIVLITLGSYFYGSLI
jgi:hypothetical protein